MLEFNALKEDDAKYGQFDKGINESQQKWNILKHVHENF